LIPLLVNHKISSVLGTLAQNPQVPFAGLNGFC
jgi:hypothetical protein